MRPRASILLIITASLGLVLATAPAGAAFTLEPQQPAPDGFTSARDVPLVASLVNQSSQDIDTVTAAVDGKAVPARLEGSQVVANVKNLTEAEHDALIAAENDQGERAWANWSFTVDRTAPTVSYPGVNSGPVHAKPDGRVEIRMIDRVSGLAPDLTQARVDGRTIATTADASTGIVSLVSLPGQPGASQTLELDAVDKAGNSRTYSWTLILDGTPPEVVETVPADGAVLASSPTELSVVVREPSGLESAQTRLTLDGDPLEFGKLTRSGEETTLSLDLPWTLDDAEHRLAVHLTDAAGNQRNVTWNVTVDSRPPAIEMRTDLDAELEAGDEIHLGLSDTGSGFEEDAITARLGDAPLEVHHRDGSTFVVPLTDVPSGTHTLHVAVSDAAGNQAEGTWTVAVASAGVVGIPMQTAAIAGAGLLALVGVAAGFVWARSRASDEGTQLEEAATETTAEIAPKTDTETEPAVDAGRELETTSNPVQIIERDPVDEARDVLDEARKARSEKGPKAALGILDDAEGRLRHELDDERPEFLSEIRRLSVEVHLEHAEHLASEAIRRKEAGEPDALEGRKQALESYRTLAEKAQRWGFDDERDRATSEIQELSSLTIRGPEGDEGGAADRILCVACQGEVEDVNDAYQCDCSEWYHASCWERFDDCPVCHPLAGD